MPATGTVISYGVVNPQHPYSDKSDSQSDDEGESVSETNSQHSEEYVLQPFGYQELVLGISIGFAIGLYFDSLFGNQ
jgi:hypothetical protein